MAVVTVRGNKKGGRELKIEINISEDVEDIEITFSCRKLTPAVERMLATLMVMDKKLTVIKDDETYFLDVAKVIYLESVDRKTFIYTEESVYESSLKLYELEQQLDEFGFFRANKSCLIQLKYVKSLKADINRKIRVTLENGEQVMVSRQYAEGLKKKLGVK
ncbi:MAG: LytTR family transcriptional regulator DNA-binding domain-containing protein [Lachnospiraceae bacterium]|nr:LytTR family transcriptional regulator DNA-binding domain-containing protein [Lachnospiraceae bacterium]MDE7332904.1 LytTR family transcriptional regulator DNA-binding domain-containing protein [Lachnospiraceae bacterium]